MSLAAGDAPDEIHLSVDGVTKRFGGFTALSDVSLHVRQGELVSFLGPSGCGKTTLLRVIAGLDPQDSGAIRMSGRDVSALPPAERDFGIVFQSYALFPNLTVADNVGYGLASRGTDRAAIKARVAELLEMVGLPDQGRKYPVQLSGGQQQRVALARALATSPSLLLLDEPLSALDARVRVRLRSEIKDLQRRLGVTTIMVTHDQEEALSMADRIVVMNEGAIEQVGTPADIYSRPRTAFVADFVGAMNFLDGTALDDATLAIGEVRLTAPGHGIAAGAPVRIGFRPEDVRVLRRPGSNSYAATVTGTEFLGSFVRAALAFKREPERTFTADFSANDMRDLQISRGSELIIDLPPEALRVFA
ncbi:MAG: putative 2-aminoethylphosphonate ABC transporter ATP-binding protein [Beijerinckiaceae bacterium]